MGLFTDPIVLSDDFEVSNDRTFNFRAQLNEGNSVVGEWIEPAALAAERSKLIVKHSVTNAGTERHLLQRSSHALLPDGLTYSPITVNVTVSHNQEMAVATVAEQISIALDAAGQATFPTNLLNGLI